MFSLENAYYFGDIVVIFQNMSMIVISFNFQIIHTIYTMLTLQTHHVYSTLKQRRNDRSHVVSTCNTRGVFVGEPILDECNQLIRFVSKKIQMIKRLILNP